MKFRSYIRLFAGVLLVTVSTSAIAQSYLENPKYGPDEETRKECAKNLSLYGTFYKHNNYKDAYKPWQNVIRICPAASINTYIRGVRLLKARYEEVADPAQKKALVDSLMMIYDLRITHFNKKGMVLGQKAEDLFTLAPDRYEEAFNIAKEAISIEKANSNPSTLFAYVSIAKVMYDNQKLTADQVIELYSQVSDYIDAQATANPNDDKAKQAKDGIDAIFAGMGVANCDNIIALFEPRFKATPEDVNLCKKIRSLMSANRCTSHPLYLNASIQIFKSEPNADLALDIARLQYEAKNAREAEKYYNEAINLESAVEKRANIYYELALLTFTELKNLPKAREIALKAIEENPNMGKAYKLIGDIYASERNCGSNDFEKKTVYWAAVDKYIKAKQVDPELTDAMDNLINTYSQYYPSKEDIFFYDLKVGDSYTVGCWINERTTVRDRK
ncbi:tetratricopeptide repeat protein [Tenuifilum osseticum]|uniref:tetratricopeptide repeat protein n=1 Tax=Tenuifilum osseticum TaxID=3374723 RepID=UPI0034E4C40E